MAAEQTKYAEGTVCWIEILREDVAACKKFYEALFPSWTFREEEQKTEGSQGPMYHVKPTAIPGLSGGIAKPKLNLKSSSKGKPSGVVYYMVDSIEKTQEKVHQLGGDTLLEKTPESEYGYYAVMSDPEGNAFGIYELKK